MLMKMLKYAHSCFNGNFADKPALTIKTFKKIFETAQVVLLQTRHLQIKALVSQTNQLTLN